MAPDESGRARRHPAALEENGAIEQGFSEQPDHPRPVDDEAHPPLADPTSGTLSSVTSVSEDDLPIEDSGVSVDPEHLGQQFLRDATEQNNFESSAHHFEIAPGAYPLGQLISEATLEASGQEGVELPRSSSLGVVESDALDEATLDEVDLTANAIRGGSLFDHEHERERDAVVPIDTHAPELDTDETADFDEHRGPPGVDEDARAEEMERLRAALRKNPDRRTLAPDRETWNSNRHADGGAPPSDRDEKHERTERGLK